MNFLFSIPLLLIIFITYNVIAFTSSSGLLVFSEELIHFTLVSGRRLSINLDTLLVLFGIVTLFLELLKSTRTSVTTIVDHVLSTILFVAFLLQFLLVPELGTQGFLLLASLSLIDVIAGFTISISTAKRDFSIDR